MPSFIYYYVPGSGRGSDVPYPSGPLDKSFTNTTDGIGLNMGCPVRLVRALNALNRLPEKDQKEPRSDLCASTKHLSIIEELLWLDGWRAASEVRRGGSLCGSKKQVDWFLKSAGFPMYLEAKFRPSDWVHLSDQGTHSSPQGSLLSRAADQFATNRCDDAVRVVCISTPASLTEKLVHEFGHELDKYPQIDAVIFRPMTQMTHVLSLSSSIVGRLLDCLLQPQVRSFPTNYGVFWHIAKRNERIQKRQTEKPSSQNGLSRVFCDGKQPLIDVPVAIAPEGAYRMSVTSRTSEGEPTFVVIPKEIWVNETS